MGAAWALGFFGALGRIAAVAMALAGMGAAARALETVALGSTLSMTDLPFFIAEKRGYFAAEGISINNVSFDSAARMIAPLASGELDVGSGGPSAGLYNAIGRGVGVRIVADKTTSQPGRHSQILLARKALIDNGRLKTLSDLKGLKLANAAPGSSAMGTLNRLYKMAGLAPGDIEKIFLGFPQQIVALQNGAADLAMPTEPFASEAVRRGYAVAFRNDDDIYPGHQIAVILYSDKFRVARPKVALGFMRAYLKGVRDQNASIVDGRITGKDSDEFIALIAENTSIKDRDFLRSLTVSANDGDGKLNIDSLREDFEVFRAEGLIESKIGVDDALDLTFAQAAVKSLDQAK